MRDKSYISYVGFHTSKTALFVT